jgi:DNA-binding transcriptional MerR regulator
MQNRLQQLDLFASHQEPAQPVEKEEAIPPVISGQTPVTEEPDAAVPETIAAPETNPVVTAIEPVAAPVVAVGKAGSKRGRKSFREMDQEADMVEVPDDEVLKQKLYYSISEVAGWFKVNTSLLRYWENEFDILQPRKTRKGDRLFRMEDIKNLQLIYFLLRQRKFSIDGAKNYLRNKRQEADMQAQLVNSLNKFRSFLLELKASL